MKNRYRKFERNFKENIVKISFDRSSIKEVADEFGIRPCLLTKWRKEYQKFGEGSFKGSGYVRVHPEQKVIFDLEKKLKEAELRFEILKSATPHLYNGKRTVYQFINKNEKKYSIALMCDVLEVSNGTYIRWKNIGVSDKQREIAALKEEIILIFLSLKKLSGRGRIMQELHNKGYIISLRQGSNYMKKLGLHKVVKRKFKVTTDSKHTFYTAPNVLNREFKVDIPSKVWVSDITYIQTKRGFLYLTIIMDLYDRKIIGWSLGTRLSTLRTTVPALEMAVTNRTLSPGLIFHSDRGTQYANKAFTSRLDFYQCVRSMSRKGDHLDNSVSESFFSSFKRELIDKRGKLLTQKLMRIEVFEFIENWYNKNRRHSALGYQTIEEFNTAKD